MRAGPVADMPLGMPVAPPASPFGPPPLGACHNTEPKADREERAAATRSRCSATLSSWSGRPSMTTTAEVSTDNPGPLARDGNNWRTMGFAAHIPPGRRWFAPSCGWCDLVGGASANRRCPQAVRRRRAVHRAAAGDRSVPLPPPTFAACEGMSRS